MNQLKIRNNYFLLFFCLFMTLTVFCSGNLAASDQKPKYIFLFIGDGMGISQRKSAEQYFSENHLLMDTFPAQGITTTYAANRFITGSAAAATAIASGSKTNIGELGMDPEFKEVKSVATMAKEKGWEVGIISSVSIDHATPAAFYAHVPSRDQYYDIGIALTKSNFDFFGGGGFKDPINARNNSQFFQGNVFDIAEKNGYDIISDKGAFMGLKPGDGKIIAYNHWLQNGQALPYAIDRREQDISLAEFTTKGIELLNNSEGFFLMVEGGKIDWACHANDGVSAINDTLAFDTAIKEAFEFYQNHQEETIIIVTGDHETGGMSLGFAGTKYESYFSLLKEQKVSFQKFTNDTLVNFKKSAGKSIKFDSIKPVITEYFGLKFQGDTEKDRMVLKEYEVVKLNKAFQLSIKNDDRDPTKQGYLLYGGYEPLTIALTHILNNKSGVAWTSYQHTGVPVITSAIGTGAEMFNGAYDNIDIAKKIMNLMDLPTNTQYMGNMDAMVRTMVN